MFKRIAPRIEKLTTAIISGERVYMLVPVCEETSIAQLNQAAGYVVEEEEKEEVQERAQEVEEKPAEISEGGSEEPKKTRGRKKKEPVPEKKKEFDLGKALALHMAGWSNEKIADEMGVTEQEIVERLHEAENE